MDVDRDQGGGSGSAAAGESGVSAHVSAMSGWQSHWP